MLYPEVLEHPSLMDESVVVFCFVAKLLYVFF